MNIYLDFTFGVLGNILSLMVFLAPVPTFYQIYKKKSTEGFQSVPYVVGLFSATLWIYYAFLKPDTTLLITINSVGCFIQTIYISLFIFYAPKTARLQTVALLLSLNVIGMSLIMLLTHFKAEAPKRANIVGWICLVFSLCVFVAPLFVMRRVIQTKSVEYMPFLLSFFLTLSAVMWFLYGFLRKDYNIAIPNVLGFIFGVMQMVLYLVYKKTEKAVDEKPTEMVAQMEEQIIDVVKLSTVVCPEIFPVDPQIAVNEHAISMDKPEMNIGPDRAGTLKIDHIQEMELID